MLSNDANLVLDAVYEALSHTKRRAMLRTLSYRPATVNQLAKENNLSLPAIHRHIRTLEDAGLIQRRKVGRTNFVAFKRANFATAHTWMSQFNVAWGSDNETLENYIKQLQK